MKIYIAGPMTGYENFNFPAFDAARDYLEGVGYEVFSPADNDRALLGRPLNWIPSAADTVGPWRAWNIEGAPGLRKMLGDDVEWICKEADAIAMLPGWEKSKGANAELALAKALGHEIIYLEDAA